MELCKLVSIIGWGVLEEAFSETGGYRKCMFSAEHCAVRNMSDKV